MNKFISTALKYYDTNPGAYTFPWCAAFANFVLKENGVQGTDSLLARSFLEFGTPIEIPQQGDIVILWRIEQKSKWGHNGFFVKQNDTDIYILGGNQDNTVNIKAFPKYRLLGFRTLNECTNN